MRTIIFGGSFDPIHNGHLKIAQKALEELNADKVVFLIAKTPRWKTTSATDTDRLNMLSLALKGNPQYEISLLEINSNDEVNYTYDTLIKYQKKVNEEVFFLFGTDQLEKLHLWHEIDKLCELVHLVVFKRPGYSLNEENINKYHVKVINYEVSNMSSTALRDLEDLDAPKEVLDYIVSHRLYFVNQIKSYLSDHRFNHSVSVASTAYVIAKGNGINPSKAFISGLLHDIGKEIPMEEQINFIKANLGEEYLKFQKPLYHQFVSKDIAHRVFHINDEEILDAIEYHATGKKDMSTLAKILYASDKIEPTRGYDSSEMIKECVKDINKGFIKVLDENVKFFIDKGIKYDNIFTIECIKSYLKGE